MKKTLPILSLSLILPVLAFGQSDRRTVGGVTVDLQPIHEWKQTRTGERPMQHWKDAQLKSILRPLFGGYECLVDVEERTQTIVIMHLPRSLLQLNGKQAERRKTLTALEDKAKRARTRAEQTRDEFRRTLLETDRIANIDAQAELRDLEARAAEVQAQFSKDEPRLEAMKQLLIMNTGRETSGIPIWDHGQTL